MEPFRMFQYFLCGVFATSVALNCQAEEGYSPKDRVIPKSIPAPLKPKLQFGNLPLRLERSSAVAFNKGLMPLEGRLKYLALARDARISSAGDSQELVQQAWSNYRDQISEMASRIQSLRQPAAKGWNAELLLAQYSVLRADQQIASLSGDSAKLANATDQLKVTSADLYRQREIDYSNGLASLQDLVYAKNRFINSNDSESLERISSIESAMMTQAQWHAKGAEVGRKDRLLETQLTRELVLFQDSLRSGSLDSIAEKMVDLNEVGHEHFQTTFGFYKNGTAPLHQLTTSILIRQRLQQLSEDIPELKTSNAEESFQQDWSTLKSIAEVTSDRRGRVEADLLAIDLLAVSVDSPSTKD